MTDNKEMKGKTNMVQNGENGRMVKAGDVNIKGKEQLCVAWWTEEQEYKTLS